MTNSSWFWRQKFNSQSAERLTLFVELDRDWCKRLDPAARATKVRDRLVSGHGAFERKSMETKVDGNESRWSSARDRVSDRTVTERFPPMCTSPRLELAARR